MNVREIFIDICFRANGFKLDESSMEVQGSAIAIKRNSIWVSWKFSTDRELEMRKSSKM